MPFSESTTDRNEASFDTSLKVEAEDRVGTDALEEKDCEEGRVRGGDCGRATVIDSRSKVSGCVEGVYSGSGGKGARKGTGRIMGEPLRHCEKNGVK